MADEQDWAAYADQYHLKATDTILARTAGGAGVEVPGAHILAKQVSGGPFVGDKGLQLNGSMTLAGVAPDDHGASIALDFSTYASIGQQNGGTSSGWWGWNVRGGATLGEYRYRTTGDVACLLEQTSSGGLLFKNAAAGTAGATVSLATRFEIETSGNIRPGADNTQNVGSAALRWATIYAGTGTINTSDERDKTWRSDLSDAEYAAALQIIDELGFYQWNDAVAEKGADARYHFGVRAQRAFDILDEHLGEGEWHRYAFACHDSWDDKFADVFDEEGNIVPGEQGELITPAGDRYGLREGQFAMFLLAAQARRQGELEARIAALEA